MTPPPESSHSLQLGELQQAVRWFLASPTDWRRQLLAEAFARVEWYQQAERVAGAIREAEAFERRWQSGRVESER